MDELIFGTDGWRDIIGDRFTLTNVGRAAQGYAEHLVEGGAERVLVAHDTRCNGALFARRVAEVLSANGLEVLLSDGPLPTPVLSFAITHLGAGGGVMLSASHNPPRYNGFKLKGPYGGTATEEIYADVNRRVAGTRPEGVRSPPSRTDFERIEIRTAYFRHLAGLVDLDTLASLTGVVLHDVMGGAGRGWLAGFVEALDLGIRVEQRRGAPDPLFYGVNPEPLPRNLKPLLAELSGSRPDILFAAATDGDGDRLGLVLPGGTFFNSHQIFAVLIDLLVGRGGSGRVVKTVTVSRIVERLAAARNLEVVETPVGFKYIVGAMLAGRVLIGGEESGGIGVAGHIPERDGIANSLLLLEAVARAGVPLSELFAALERETGWSHAYDRLDLQLGDRLKGAVMPGLNDPPGSFAGREVTSVERRDGVKLNLEGNAWVLFRPSGTESTLRVYCEAPSQAEVAEILASSRPLLP